MDFRIILNGYDYRDIDESDSKEEDGPDLFKPYDFDSPTPSPTLTPIRVPSLLIEECVLAISHAILPSDKPPVPVKPKLVLPTSKVYCIRARIQALTLWENGMPIPQVTEKTGVKRTALYRI
jgi:hypothetical protein